jgi:putative hydrolase of the HAD superfamily
VSAPGRGLLLDFGGVIMVSPFEMIDGLLARHGLPSEAVTCRGPFGPRGDPEWAALTAGSITEREYWSNLARRIGDLFSEDWTPLELTAALYAGSDDEFIRSDAARLVDDAREAGLPTGILTNDLELFHGRAWMDRVSILKAVDMMLDASVTGVMKPDPAAYVAAARALATPIDELVFIDDREPNVDGAEAAGAIAVALDITNPEPAFTRARELLGLAGTDHMPTPAIVSETRGELC